jgi:tetratricopeptide (TPR) repeat protein
MNRPNCHCLAVTLTVILGCSLAPAVFAQAKKAEEPAGWGGYWQQATSASPEYRKLTQQFADAAKKKNHAQALAVAEQLVARYSDHPIVYVYRGMAKRGLGHYDSARADLEKGIAQARKEQAPVIVGYGLSEMAHLYVVQGRPAEASTYFRQAIEQAPSEASFYNNFAWILATSTVASARNGAEAFKLATKANELTRWSEAGCLDTLAAACAEKGDFASAVKWQSKAIELSKSKGAVSDLNSRLALYKNQQPYHATK